MFEGAITSLTSTNDKGKFDILPTHANFISLIQESITIRLPDNTVREIPMNDAILKVEDNTIDVFLGVRF